MVAGTLRVPSALRGTKNASVFDGLRHTECAYYLGLRHTECAYYLAEAILELRLVRPVADTMCSDASMAVSRESRWYDTRAILSSVRYIRSLSHCRYQHLQPPLTAGRDPAT